MVGSAAGSLGVGSWKWAILAADLAAVPGSRQPPVTGSRCGGTSYPAWNAEGGRYKYLLGHMLARFLDGRC